MWQWLKNILAKKKQQEQWDNMYNTTTQKAENLPLDPKNNPWSS